MTAEEYVKCSRCKQDITDIIVTFQCNLYEDVKLCKGCEKHFLVDLELRDLFAENIYNITYLTEKQV